MPVLRRVSIAYYFKDAAPFDFSLKNSIIEGNLKIIYDNLQSIYKKFSIDAFLEITFIHNGRFIVCVELATSTGQTFHEPSTDYLQSQPYLSKQTFRVADAPGRDAIIGFRGGIDKFSGYILWIQPVYRHAKSSVPIRHMHSQQNIRSAGVGLYSKVNESMERSFRQKMKEYINFQLPPIIESPNVTTDVSATYQNSFTQNQKIRIA